MQSRVLTLGVLVMQANAELQSRLQTLRSQPSPLALVQAKREENAKDKDKFNALLTNLQVMPGLHDVKQLAEQ